jgi:hypothetical protein
MTGEITTLPADATINLTLFTLNDQTPLVIGPSVSPIVISGMGARNGSARRNGRHVTLSDPVLEGRRQQQPDTGHFRAVRLFLR